MTLIPQSIATNIRLHTNIPDSSMQQITKSYKKLQALDNIRVSLSDSCMQEIKSYNKTRNLEIKMQC